MWKRGTEYLFGSTGDYLLPIWVWINLCIVVIRKQTISSSIHLFNLSIFRYNTLSWFMFSLESILFIILFQFAFRVICKAFHFSIWLLAMKPVQMVEYSSIWASLIAVRMQRQLSSLRCVLYTIHVASGRDNKKFMWCIS